MNAYTVSRLALDAGVSVHIVRDYLLRGLLRPVACTPGGYGLFDETALQRLCFPSGSLESDGHGLQLRRPTTGRAIPSWPLAQSHPAPGLDRLRHAPTLRRCCWSPP